jgi:hemoglobin
MKPKGFPDDHATVEVNQVSFSHEDISNVVDEFYSRIQADPTLKEPFKSVGDWPEHIRKLTHFWWIRFGGKPYIFHNYNPVAKHFSAGFNRELLKRWLSIFNDTLRTQLTLEQAALWTSIAERMGEALFVKNELLRSAQTGDDATRPNGSS